MSDCDRCGKVRELYHNDFVGLALCEPCDRFMNTVEEHHGEIAEAALDAAWGKIGEVIAGLTSELVTGDISPDELVVADVITRGWVKDMAMNYGGDA